MTFILPTLLLYLSMVIYPVIRSFLGGFYQWDGLGKPVFIGLDNYVNLFQDKDFFTANLNGLKFAAVLVIYQIGFGTLIALLLVSHRIKYKRFSRMLFHSGCPFRDGCLPTLADDLQWASRPFESDI